PTQPFLIHNEFPPTNSFPVSLSANHTAPSDPRWHPPEIYQQPVSLAIELIVPTNADQVHLRLLSKLARKLVDHDYAEMLRWSAHDAAQLTKQVQQALAE
ncbi:PTS sugar transporter subunit IIA, partial [Pediococcus acidilactici]|nr:PTS sugar transporter subunit IIA [Pediococcus acidilactici]